MIFNEESKAIQEWAKTTGKAIDMVHDMGSFLSGFLEGPLTQVSQIVEDQLRYFKDMRALRFKMRYEERLVEYRIDAPNKKIPVKYAVPLFQAAILEDDDYLQDLWVELLIKSTNDKFKFDLNRTYIDVLERLSRYDAMILMAIYEPPFNESRYGVITKLLPQKVEIYDSKQAVQEFSLTDEITFSLSNLERLGLINAQLTLGGWKEFDMITTTVFGKMIVDSCSFSLKLTE